MHKQPDCPLVAALERFIMILSICEATETDLSAICQLGQEINRLHHQSYPIVFSPPSDPLGDLPYWKQSIDSPHSAIFVGVLSGSVVAFNSVSITTESNPFLRQSQIARVGAICVAPHVLFAL
jgi:hypothetical protein